MLVTNKCNTIHRLINSKGISLKYKSHCGIEQSAGEIKVMEALTDLKISYKREVYFPDFKTPRGGHYRFDFVLPKIGVILEYDGKRYHKSKVKDDIKDDYCKKNSIPIYRLSGNDYFNMKERISTLFKLKQTRK